MRQHDPLGPPPRALSRPLRLGVLTAGMMPQMGWAFFGFGMIFFWIFVADSELVSLARFAGPTEHARGVVTSVEVTGGTENDEDIYAVHFRYDLPHDPDAHGTRTDVSYAVGSGPPAGTEVDVEVARGAARITGLRHRRFSAWTALVCLFPLIGAGFIGASLRYRRRWPHLLAHGVLTRATRVAERPTHMQVNDEPIYEVEYEHVHDHRRYRATARTHRPSDLGLETDVLYDPDAPEDGMVLAELPLTLIAEPGGGLGAPAGALLRVLALPALVTLTHGTVLILHLIAR